MGSVWGRSGVGLGSVWGRSVVDLGSIWCRSADVMGAIWGWFGVDLQVKGEEEKDAERKKAGFIL